MKKIAAIFGILSLVVTASFLAGSCTQSSGSGDGDGDYLQLPPRASTSPAPFCGIAL
jgi:hypothetical protein